MRAGAVEQTRAVTLDERAALELGLEHAGQGDDLLDVAGADGRALLQHDLQQAPRRHQLGVEVGDHIGGESRVELLRGEDGDAHFLGTPSAGSIDLAICMAIPVPPPAMMLEVSVWGSSDE